MPTQVRRGEIQLGIASGIAKSNQPFIRKCLVGLLFQSVDPQGIDDPERFEGWISECITPTRLKTHPRGTMQQVFLLRKRGKVDNNQRLSGLYRAIDQAAEAAGLLPLVKSRGTCGASAEKVCDVGANHPVRTESRRATGRALVHEEHGLHRSGKPPEPSASLPQGKPGCERHKQKNRSFRVLELLWQSAQPFVGKSAQSRRQQQMLVLPRNGENTRTPSQAGNDNGREHAADRPGHIQSDVGKSRVAVWKKHLDVFAQEGAAKGSPEDNHCAQPRTLHERGRETQTAPKEEGEDEELEEMGRLADQEIRLRRRRTPAGPAEPLAQSIQERSRGTGGGDSRRGNKNDDEPCRDRQPPPEKERKIFQRPPHADSLKACQPDRRRAVRRDPVDGALPFSE